jgi:hypothetical protein
MHLKTSMTNLPTLRSQHEFSIAIIDPVFFSRQEPQDRVGCSTAAEIRQSPPTTEPSPKRPY